MEKGDYSVASLRMAYPFYKSIKTFDPQHITSIGDGSLSRNLYSRLLSLDDDGSISGDLADDILWDGNSYVLHIRNGVRTIDGHKISSNDVKNSLLRILHNDKNTHGSLRMFLCGANKDPMAPCPGIRVNGETIILTPSDPNFRIFLAHALAAPDFAIIPSTSMDLSKPDMPITDWKNSTGLYYVAQDDEGGALTLKINKGHYRYNHKQAETIHLKPADDNRAIELFKNGDVDFIPTPTIAPGRAYADLEKSGARVFKTQPIFLSRLVFTRRGIKRFSPLQRIKIGLSIKQALLKKFDPADGEEVSEFFPAFSEGSLTEEQKLSLRNIQKQALGESVPKPATLVTFAARFDEFQDALKGVKEVRMVRSQGRPPWEEPEDRQPDIFFSMTDSGFYESLSLLYYNFELNAFLDKADGLRWINDFIRTPQKEIRIRKLNQLHFDFLTNGRVIPITMSSYHAVTRDPFTANFSKFFAGTPLWNLITD